MSKKTLLPLLIVSIGSAIAVSSYGLNDNPLKTFAGDECATNGHRGNHYAANDPTDLYTGNEGFFACCKCHHQYLDNPGGVWTERALEENIPSTHVAYISRRGKTIDNCFLSANGISTTASSIEAPRGFENVRFKETTDYNVHGQFYSSIDLQNYKETYFSIKSNGTFNFDNKSYYEGQDWLIFRLTNNENLTWNLSVSKENGDVVYSTNNLSGYKGESPDPYTNYSLNSILYGIPDCGFYPYKTGETLRLYVTEVIGVDFSQSTPVDTVKATGLNFDNSYKIIYEDNGDKNIAKAAEDIFYYLGLSSSWSLYLPPAADPGTVFDQNTKVISIGNTAFYKGSGLSTFARQGESGFAINTRGKAILINAYDTRGMMSAAQYFLNKTIGLNIYSFANKEIAYTSSSQIPVMNFNAEIIPTVARRDIAIGTDVLAGSQRMYLGYTFDLNDPVTLNQYHSMGTTLLSYSTYSASHPDWYSEGTEKQLCYSAHGSASEYASMKQTIASEIESLVSSSETDDCYVNMSIDDNWSWCDCASCQAVLTAYGTYAGQQLHFVSEVADIVDQWIAANKPTRKAKYVTLAYQQCQEPPSNLPYSLNKHVIVQYAPVKSDFSKQFSTTENSSYYAELCGWSNLMKDEGLTNNLWMWVYSESVKCYMLPNNDFDAVAGQYETFSSLGVSKIMVELPYYNRGASFEDLSIYLKGHFMSYSKYDYESLVADFMDHYYGSASTNMKSYYDLLTTTLKNSGVGGSIWDTADSKDIWTKEKIKSMISLLDQCLTDVASIENEERRTELENRIHRERCTPIYLLLEHYLSSHAYSKSAMQGYVNELETYTTMYGITKTSYTTTTETKISDYRTKVNKLLY